jgi:hypothetical protein
MQDHWIRAGEVQRMTGACPETVRNWARRGYFRFYTVPWGNRQRWYFDEISFLRWWGSRINVHERKHG